MTAFWDVAPCSLVVGGHFENKLNRACVPKIIFLNLNNSTFTR
jgi:hypothetical protein